MVPDRAEILPPDVDPVKAESVRIFYARYLQAKDDPDYLRLKEEHLTQTVATDA